MTSYVANLKEGDKITVFGPTVISSSRIHLLRRFGLAAVRVWHHSESHIFDELRRKGTTTKMSYWYGARSLKEMFYKDEFDQLAC